jgi:hypothetical protein
MLPPQLADDRLGLLQVAVFAAPLDNKGLVVRRQMTP